MKISEIIALENINKGCINLISEGLFWRAYERSAYLFFYNLKEFKIIKKKYNNVNLEVIYLGFPSSSLESVLEIAKNKIVTRTEKIITISNFKFDNADFMLWKSTIESQNKLVPKIQDIATKILQFSVVDKTPIECQQFIISLQKELRNGTI